ncbi:MAG: hypothetical protein GQE15_42335 [Archangiaceae bacterium]|nr:hypothetical protein [Archangiaceae bacterium]
MTWAMVCAVVLAQGPTPERHLEQATQKFGAHGFRQEYAALLDAIRALPAADPRRRTLICEALHLGEHSGDSAKLEKDLRALVNTLESQQPSIATLSRFVVKLHATRTFDRSKWTTQRSTEVPQDLPCEEWDAGAARLALAMNLGSRGMDFLATPAQRRAADKLATEAYLELHRRVSTDPSVDDALRASLFDLSLVFCASPKGGACPPEQEALTQALALRTKAFGPSDERAQQSALNLAVWFEEKGRLADAEKTLRTIFPGVQATSSSELTREAAMALFLVAQSSRAPDAWEIGGWAVRELAKVPDEAYAPTLYFLRDGAELATRAQRTKDAVEWLTVCVQLGEAQGGPFAMAAADDRLRLATALEATGDLEAADAQYVKAIASLSESADGFVETQRADRWREVAAAEKSRAGLLEKLGKKAEARALRDSARAHEAPKGKPPKGR